MPDKKKLLLIMFLILGISAVSCNSSRSSGKDNSKDDTKVEKPDISTPPSPGQADVIALIEKYSESENIIISDIKITEVLKYGSSAPALAVGSEIKLSIQKQAFDTQKHKFKEGETVSMRIAFYQGINNKNGWEFVMFIEK
jgi:hypothetical protein